MRKAQFFYLLRRGLVSGGLNLIKEGLVMASKFTTQGLSFPAQGSATFNGSSDYIQLPDPFSHTNHTIACWAYLDNSSATRIIFDNREGSGDGIVVYFDSSDRPSYLVNGAFRNTSTAYENVWVYIVGTYDGGTQKLYIDGSLITSQSTSQTISTANNAIIGRRRDLVADYFKGNLANVAIWNRALSSDEINSVMWKSYEALATTEKSGLQAWYKLNESELISGDDTATLTKYAEVNGLIFEQPACVQTALNNLPDITDARLYSAKYDIRVSADGGTVESLSCVETELNAIL